MIPQSNRPDYRFTDQKKNRFLAYTQSNSLFHGDEVWLFRQLRGIPLTHGKAHTHTHTHTHTHHMCQRSHSLFHGDQVWLFRQLCRILLTLGKAHTTHTTHTHTHHITHHTHFSTVIRSRFFASSVGYHLDTHTHVHITHHTHFSMVMRSGFFASSVGYRSPTAKRTSALSVRGRSSDRIVYAWSVRAILP